MDDNMPTFLAVANEASLLSPVTILTVMPAFSDVEIASVTPYLI
jgi:hypothetical protein